MKNPKLTKNPFLLRGLIRCGLTNQMCVCEIKKQKYIYIFCYHADGSRYYVPEQNILRDIEAILNRIHLPDNVVFELKEELKKAKSTERKYCRDAITKLKTEQDKFKDKLDHLFDLRLDGELDRETFDTKRNELQIKLNRLKNKVTAHEKADKGFDETILGLLDIATQARNIFDRSQNLELKRLLLKFVFESLTLTEGTLTYKLKFPFEMFVDNNILRAKAAKSYEPMQTLEKQGIQANDNENLQMGYMNFYEPQISDKNQGVRPKNLTPLQIGDPNGIRTHITTVKG